MKYYLLCILLAVPALAQIQEATIPLPPNPPAPLHRELKSSAASVAKSDFQIQTTAYSIGQPTDEEQLYLELINRARANPTAEGIRLATTTEPNSLQAFAQYKVNLNVMKSEFAALPVRQPLAMNRLLTNAARLHTEYQFNSAQQTHESSDGTYDDKRVEAQGYDWANLGENVYCFASNTVHGHEGFQVDWGSGANGTDNGMQTGRGHRVNIHSDFRDHSDFREVGIGVVLGNKVILGSNPPVDTKSVGPHLVTQNFGTTQTNTPFVTGVAYYDLNGNNFYDLGEGIGGLTVNVDGSSFHAITSNSGGYAVPVSVADATRAITFTGLGANGTDSAVVTNANNVKVDFKPAFVPATLTGSDVIQTGLASNYSYNSVLGATGYKGHAVLDVNTANDGADNLNRVTVNNTGSYTATSSSVKFTGTGSYRLAYPEFGTQTLTYQNSFYVKAGASLSFRSRLGIATTAQVARVEVSRNNGLSWEQIYAQAGAGSPGETSFQARTASLAAYAGATIRLRFNFSFSSGTFFNQTTDGFGWYIDDITFGDLIDTSSATTSTLPAGTAFLFTPPSAGSYLLAVSPIISSRDLGFGPVKAVLVTDGPPSLAEIEVEQPAASGLIDGASTIDFGTKYPAQPEIRTFTIKNTGTEDLSGLSLSIDGTHASEFVSDSLGSLSLAPAASTTFTVTFTPTATGVRTATLRIASNDANENPFDIALTGRSSNAPTIMAPPVALIRNETAQASLTVSAFHPTLTPIYTWKKNGVIIKGAVSSTLNFSSVKLTDGGNYSVVVSAGGEFIETPPVVLAVVRPVTQNFVQLAGTTIRPAVAVSGAATLTWKKTSGAQPIIETLTTPTPLTLVLANLNANSSSAVYTCEASVPNVGMLLAGTFDVKVFNAKPQITASQGMPDGIVSSSYTHQIKCGVGTEITASSYSMTPTIPGLKLNATTGLITGKPTLAKPYTVTLTARNSLGFTITTDEIFIAPIPQNVEGVYTGVVARNVTLNGNLGGRVDLTIANTGFVSGSINLGAQRYALTGAMDISQAVPPAAPEATATIKRTGTLLPLTLRFSLDTATDRLTNASVTDGTNTAQIQGWRSIWKATGIQQNPATDVPKLFTFALKPPALPASMPRGDGYGSFTLAKDGKLSVAGKTGDGESYTSATFLGPQGQVLIFGTLLSKGSLVGRINIDMATDIISGTSTVSWIRPPNATSRTYPLGYGLVDTEEISAVGSKFTVPTAPALILGMALGDKAQLSFADGGLTSAAIKPNVAAFDILAKNVAKLPIALSAENPGSVKLTGLSATTGLFTGTFVLEDPELRTASAFVGKKLKRTVNFAGILTQDGGSSIGAGHFLLPELPRDTNPATTPTNSQILSGSVLMQKKP